MPFLYESGSIAPHFSEIEMDSLRRHVKIDYHDFEFDPAYVAHIREFNGGRLITNYFRTAQGRWFPIDRVLNFSDHHRIQDRSINELNVNAMWSAIGDRLTIYQFPFAVLRGGDFLCFDYEHGFPPQVVLWYHEGSEEGSPRTEFVASNFREFLDGLAIES